MSSTITQSRQSNNWDSFCEWVTSTDNRLYVGWFGVLMIPTLLGTICFHRCVRRLNLLWTSMASVNPVGRFTSISANNIISGVVVPSSNAIGLHFYPIWEAFTLDE